MGYVFTSSDFKARILRPIITILMRMTLNSKSARLVVLNSTDFDLFKTKRIVKPEYIRLIPGAGIDCTKYTPSKTHVNAEFRVLLAARLLWDKGVAEYIQASRLIKNKGLSISFLLAGAPDPGNPAAVPESLLVKWVSEGLIKFLGHIDDMPSLLKTINVVVLPSYREGLPTGLTEAGACGLSIITTDVPGCNEVVTHEIDGLLVPVKDSAALADAIQRLYLNPELCKKLGEAARYNAVARFDNKIVIGKTLDIYEELKRNSSLNNNIIN
jgi:glycosyltransferase involved in cell wall biosynthesis